MNLSKCGPISLGRENVIDDGEMPFREKNRHRFLGAKRDVMFQNAEMPSDVNENRWIYLFSTEQITIWKLTLSLGLQEKLRLSFDQKQHCSRNYIPV